MPLDFPDFVSLVHRAEQRGFRQPYAGEAEHEYRQALADHMLPIDLVEALEISAGVGWDQYNAWDRLILLKRLRERKAVSVYDAAYQ